jgi:hypothetical protein
MTVAGRFDGAWRQAMVLTAESAEAARGRALRVIAGDCWAEIRVPEGRPSLVGKDSLQRATPQDLIALGNQRGGAGRLRQAGDGAALSVEIAFAPDGGEAEDNRLSRAGDLLVERAGEGTGRADWKLEPGSAGARGAYVLEERAEGLGFVRRGALVLAGDHLILVRERMATLAGARPWAERIGAAAGDAGRLANLLDFEISHARRDGPGALWQITLSTLPFREGTLLAGEIGAAATRGDATLVERTLVDGREVERRWTRRTQLS